MASNRRKWADFYEPVAYGSRTSGLVRSAFRRAGVRSLFLNALDVFARAGNFAFEMADAKEGSDACDEFELVDRFGEEVIRTGLDAAFDIAQFVECGDHNDGNPTGFRVCFELFADFEAGHAGHHDVQQNHIGFDLLDNRERLEAVGSGENLTGEYFKVSLKEFEILLVVIHDKNLGDGESGLEFRDGLWVGRNGCIGERSGGV